MFFAREMYEILTKFYLKIFDNFYKIGSYKLLIIQKHVKNDMVEFKINLLLYSACILRANTFTAPVGYPDY